MKYLIILLIFLTSCGPSADEKASAENARQELLRLQQIESVNGPIEYKYSTGDIVWLKLVF